MKIRTQFFLLLLGVLSLLTGTPLKADQPLIPGEPPRRTDNRLPENTALGGYINPNDGSAEDGYTVTVLRSGGSPSASLVLSYSSAKAAIEANAAVNTSLGFGWSHSFGSFLYRQQGYMFRRSGDGLNTKFNQTPGTDSPVLYTPPSGYFESMVGNADGSFVITYPDGGTETFRNFPGCPYFFKSPIYELVERKDRNGNAATLGYDTHGRLATIADTYGRVITFTYNRFNKIETITDPLGRVTRLSYTTFGAKLSAIIDPLGFTVQYGYDKLFRLSSKTGKNGDVFQYSSLAGTQRSSAVLDSGGNRTLLMTAINPNSWATDPNAVSSGLLLQFRPSTETNIDARGFKWVQSYDTNGYTTAIIAPDGTAKHYGYDPASFRLASATNSHGGVTRYQYDARGNLTQITDALGNVTVYTYDPSFGQLTSSRDSSGRLTTYLLDARGNRVRETDPLGNNREWTYDSHGNALTAKDKRGFVTSYAYDAYGNLSSSTDPTGCTTYYSFDILGNLLSRTDGNGNTTTFTYDALDRLESTTDPLGATQLVVYDALGRRIRVTDCDQRTMSLAYNFCGRVLAETNALGGVTRNSYDGNGTRTSTTDPLGRVTAFVYDSQNRLVSTTNALGGITSVSYDGEGNVLSRTDANGHTTTYVYDALNRLIAQTDANGGTTTYEYATLGNPGSGGPQMGSRLVTKTTDANGKVTYFKYDLLDRQTTVVHKEGDTLDVIDATDAVTSTAYDPNGNRLSFTDPSGRVNTYEYDPLGRILSTTNGAGEVTAYGYDCAGNVVSVTSPNGNITANTYDEANRLVQVEDLIGRVANYGYDCSGKQIFRRDGNGDGPVFEYDALHRLVRTYDADGMPTVNVYDLAGNLVQVTDRNGHATAYKYDALNRRVLVTDPLGHKTSFDYDSVGNLTAQTDANGHVTAYAYDSLNRLVQETAARSAPNTRIYTYDPTGHILTRTDSLGKTTAYRYNDLYFLLQRSYPKDAADNFSYDLAGHRLTAEKEGWLITFAYDGAGRMVESVQNGQSIGYAYDTLGRTRTIAYPGGRVIVEANDVRDNLTTVQDAGSTAPIAAYGYDAASRVVELTSANGVVSQWTYDPNGWVLSIDHVKGNTRIAGFNYAYDFEGNRRSEQNLKDPSDSESYHYDALNRLVNFTAGTLVHSSIPRPQLQTAWNLDPVGNWNQVTENGVVENRVHDAANEITSINGVSVLNDANGSLTDDGIRIYSYDDENRLVEVQQKSDGTVLGLYRYDALGRRVARLSDPGQKGTLSESRYFYDGQRIIEDQSDRGATIATYVYGNGLDEVLAMNRSGVEYYHHRNALGSARVVTSASGVVVERYDYDPYGAVSITDGRGRPVSGYDAARPRSAICNRYLFTGRELDPESGLYYYRARHYSPSFGRFLQRDPMGAFGSDVNLHEYARGNSIIRIDPLGLTSVPSNWPVICSPSRGSFSFDGLDNQAPPPEEHIKEIGDALKFLNQRFEDVMNTGPVDFKFDPSYNGKAFTISGGAGYENSAFSFNLDTFYNGKSFAETASAGYNNGSFNLNLGGLYSGGSFTGTANIGGNTLLGDSTLNLNLGGSYSRGSITGTANLGVTTPLEGGTFNLNLGGSFSGGSFNGTASTRVSTPLLNGMLNFNAGASLNGGLLSGMANAGYTYSPPISNGFVDISVNAGINLGSSGNLRGFGVAQIGGKIPW